MDIENENQSKKKYQNIIVKCAQWDTIPIKNPQQFPVKRIKHSALLYKGMLYVYGGITQQNIPYNPRIIYKYDFIINMWIAILTNIPTNLIIKPIYGHAATIYFNTMHIFGGIDLQGQCCNGFYGLNLQSNHWKKIQQKGQLCPCPRQSASMMLYKSMIFLYGGKNKQQIYNDFYFYRFDTKSWYITQTTQYTSILSKRYSPGICVNDNYIYIFGGQFIKSGGNKIIQKQQQDNIQCQFLNDFYQIEILFRSTTVFPQAKVTKIITPITPNPRSGQILINCQNSRYLVLLGGGNSLLNRQKQQNNNDIWVYDTKRLFWFPIIPKKSQLKNILMFSCVQYQDKLFTYGGMTLKQQYNTKINKLTINFKNMPIQNLPIQQICSQCIQQLNRIPSQKIYLQNLLLDNLLYQLQYPFSAFGLLIDNCINVNSSICNIIYINTQRQKYCLIQDNGQIKLWQDNHQFIQCMLYMHHPIISFQENNTKKPKEFQSKDDQSGQKKAKRVYHYNEQQKWREKKKIYGFNLKIGGLRLGKTVLYLNKDQKSKRAALFRKETDQNGTRYACYYYIIQQGKFKDTNMYTARKVIDDEYKNYIKIFQDKKNINTCVFILDWEQYKNKDGQLQTQLISQYNLNDILIANPLISKMQNIGYQIYQCCDVSLRSYLSLLYIKNQTLSIHLGVKQSKLQLIPTQMFLDKIDKMSKNKTIIQLDGVIDFPCKINQIYFNPDLKKKLPGFHNGILLYHKNRLISRYKYNLGKLLQKKQYEIQNKYNLLQLFGYIQLPDTFPVNNLKNNFIMQSFLLENLYSRLKFVQKAIIKKIIIKQNYINIQKGKRLNDGNAQINSLGQNLKETPHKKIKID